MDGLTIQFWIIAVVTGLCAIAVVVTQNIVRCAVWLLFTLGGTSGLFFVLGADFVGATQLLVYVGGTLVLVVFGVMLTAQGPFITMKIGAAEWAIASVVGLVLFAVLAVTVWSLAQPATPAPQTASQMNEPAGKSMNSALIGEALVNVKEATPAANLTGLQAGAAPRQRQQMGYLLPFEIVSVHLLVVLIGAAYLARAKRRRGVVNL